MSEGTVFPRLVNIHLFMIKLQVRVYLRITFFVSFYSVLGAVLIAVGLYSVLWGKYKEYKGEEPEEILPEAVMETGADNNDDIEMQKDRTTPSLTETAVAVAIPVEELEVTDSQGSTETKLIHIEHVSR